MNISPYLLFKMTLFLYMAVAMHIVLPTPGGSGLYIAPNVFGWVFIIILIGSCLWQIAKQKLLVVNKIDYFILIGTILFVIPLCYSSSDFSTTIFRVLGLCFGALLLFCLSQLKLDKAQKGEILSILQIGILIECIIGLIQFFILSQFEIQILGYTPLFDRPYGSFTQPNVMASFMATGVVLALFLIFYAKKYSLKKWVVNVSYLNLLCCTLLLIPLQSKTGFLGLIISMILLLFIFKNHFPLFKKAISFLVLGVCIGLVATSYLKSIDRGDNLYSDKGVRTDIIWVSANLFSQNPIQGVGYGNFEKEYRLHHLSLLETDIDWLGKPLEKLDHPHNEFLLWVVEGGVAPLVGFLIILLAFILQLIKTPWEKSVFIIALLVPILLHTQTEYPFYHSIIHFVFFIFFLWLIKEENHSTKYIEVRNTGLFKLSAISLPAVGFVFCLTTIQTMMVMESYKVGGFKNHQQLDSITNTISWSQYIDVTVHTRALMHGFENKNPNALISYIHWGLEFTELKPRKNIYKNMILAIGTLERVNHDIPSELSARVFANAATLYPDVEW